jgi:hypothetical protein
MIPAPTLVAGEGGAGTIPGLDVRPNATGMMRA